MDLSGNVFPLSNEFEGNVDYPGFFFGDNESRGLGRSQEAIDLAGRSPGVLEDKANRILTRHSSLTPSNTISVDFQPDFPGQAQLPYGGHGSWESNGDNHGHDEGRSTWVWSPASFQGPLHGNTFSNGAEHASSIQNFMADSHPCSMHIIEEQHRSDSWGDEPVTCPSLPKVQPSQCSVAEEDKLLSCANNRVLDNTSNINPECLSNTSTADIFLAMGASRQNQLPLHGPDGETFSKHFMPPPTTPLSLKRKRIIEQDLSGIESSAGWIETRQDWSDQTGSREGVYHLLNITTSIVRNPTEVQKKGLADFANVSYEEVDSIYASKSSEMVQFAAGNKRPHRMVRSLRNTPRINAAMQPSGLGLSDSAYYTNSSNELKRAPKRARASGSGVQPPRRERPFRFHCTWPSCPSENPRFTSKHDWNRHEETIHCLQYTWKCPVSVSPALLEGGEITCGEVFKREDKFTRHLARRHNLAPGTMVEDHRKAEDPPNIFRHECGFCGNHLLTWQERTEHVSKHFMSGMEMSEWRDPWPRDENGGGPGPENDGNDDNHDDHDSHHGHDGHDGSVGGEERGNSTLEENQNRDAGSRCDHYDSSENSGHIQTDHTDGHYHTTSSGLEAVIQPGELDTEFERHWEEFVALVSQTDIRMDSTTNHLSMLTDRKIPCSFCAEEFLRRGDLTLHLLLHTRKASFKYGRCKDTFSCIDILGYHFQICAMSHDAIEVATRPWILANTGIPGNKTTALSSVLLKCFSEYDSSAHFYFTNSGPCGMSDGIFRHLMYQLYSDLKCLMMIEYAAYIQKGNYNFDRIKLQIWTLCLMVETSRRLCGQSPRLSRMHSFSIISIKSYVATQTQPQVQRYVLQLHELSTEANDVSKSQQKITNDNKRDSQTHSKGPPTISEPLSLRPKHRLSDEPGYDADTSMDGSDRCGNSNGKSSAVLNTNKVTAKTPAATTGGKDLQSHEPTKNVRSTRKKAHVAGNKPRQRMATRRSDYRQEDGIYWTSYEPVSDELSSKALEVSATTLHGAPSTLTTAISQSQESHFQGTSMLDIWVYETDNKALTLPERLLKNGRCWEDTKHRSSSRKLKNVVSLK